MRAYLTSITGPSIMLLCAHAYLYRRLVHDTTVFRRRRRVLGACLAGAALFSVLTDAFSRLLPVAIAQWAAWPGYLWWAVAFYLAVALALLEIPRGLLWLRQRARERTAPAVGQLVAQGGRSARGEMVPELAPGPRVDRRTMLARSFAVAAGALSVGTVASGVRCALGPPEVLRFRVPLRGLSPGLAGLRIATVADIHVCAFHRRPHVERMVRMINDIRPDAVAIVGDLADGSLDQLGADVEPLRDLRSTFGTYFVTGNHEYFSDVDAWLDQLRELGVRPLLNERVEIAGAGGFDIAGVNDLSAAEANQPGPNLDRAFAGRDPERPVVLLAHQPVIVAEAARHGADLLLAGHTHGGQMQPLGLLTRLQQPSIAGWSAVGHTRMYVTRGVGTFGPPVRVGASPEITVIELQAGGRP